MGVGQGVLGTLGYTATPTSGNGQTTTNNVVGQTTANNAMQPIQTISPAMGIDANGVTTYATSSQQANTSNPNTPTLGTGQTANPYQGSTNPYIQAAQATTMGNLYGAQAATQANRINQNTPYGSLNYTQGVDANGNPTWTANQQLSQPLQDLTNTSLQGLQQSLQNPMYGINPGQTYSDAIMQRLSPQLAQQSESNTAALANQGIVPGTRAYENAMRTFQQGQNDLLTSAQIQGMNTGLQAQQLQGTQAGQIKNLATPNLINAPTQAAVAGPDYMGAVGSQTAAEIAANNARLGQQTANTQGLYGLGSAGILGLAANPGLVSSGLTGLGNLLGSGYNTISNNYFTNPTSGGSFASDIFKL